LERKVRYLKLIIIIIIINNIQKNKIMFLIYTFIIIIRYGAIEQSALAFSINDVFSPILRQRIEFYSTNPTADNISRVQAQIETVKEVMVENIDRVLERGEKIELLVDKTDRLNQQAFKFERSSRTLKQEMLCKKYRNNCIILFILLVCFFIYLCLSLFIIYI
jgi:vesicle-associated membrane protein 7